MSERTKKREAPISFRPQIGPDGLRALAQSRGLSVNAFLNAAISGERIPRSRRSAALDEKTIGKLFVQLAKIKDGLGQGTPPTDPFAVLLLEDIQNELEEIRACLMLLAGREP
jgi:hypothetical protein